VLNNRAHRQYDVARDRDRNRAEFRNVRLSIGSDVCLSGAAHASAQARGTFDEQTGELGGSDRHHSQSNETRCLHATAEVERNHYRDARERLAHPTELVVEGRAAGGAVLFEQTRHLQIISLQGPVDGEPAVARDIRIDAFLDQVESGGFYLGPRTERGIGQGGEGVTGPATNLDVDTLTQQTAE
jgi:hypothetical protein